MKILTIAFLTCTISVLFVSTVGSRSLNIKAIITDTIPPSPGSMPNIMPADSSKQKMITDTSHMQ